VIETVIKLESYQNYHKNKIRCLIFFTFPDAMAIAMGKNQTELVKITLKMYVFT
jgi:hypothetical protein